MNQEQKEQFILNYYTYMKKGERYFILFVCLFNKLSFYFSKLFFPNFRSSLKPYKWLRKAFRCFCGSYNNTRLVFSETSLTVSEYKIFRFVWKRFCNKLWPRFPYCFSVSVSDFQQYPLGWKCIWRLLWKQNKIQTQLSITCSKLTMETIEQDVKYV